MVLCVTRHAMVHLSPMPGRSDILRRRNRLVPRPFRRRTAAGASVDTYVVSADAVPFLSKFPSGRTVGMAIGAGRVALGTTFLSVPVTSLRIMGLDTGTATRVVWLARMTAARDVVLGAGTVCSSTRGGENS